MVKCFKLPVIQVCTAFAGILPGRLRAQNRVDLREKDSNFTISFFVKCPGKSTRKKDMHNGKDYVNNPNEGPATGFK
jgi:hypothetical protein